MNSLIGGGVLILALMYGAYWMDSNGYDRAVAEQAAEVKRLSDALTILKAEGVEKVAKVTAEANALRGKNHALIQQALIQDISFRAWYERPIHVLAADLYWSGSVRNSPGGGGLQRIPGLASADPMAP